MVFILLKVIDEYMKYFLAFLLLSCTVQTVQSSGYLTPLGQGITISKYFIHSGGGMTLWVSGISNPDNCGSANKVHLKGDLSGHDKMVAAVMAAYASGMKVGLWSSGCSSLPFWGGTVTYPIVSNLWVTN